MDENRLPAELRVMRDFFLLNIVSLLLLSGYLAHVHHEQYFVVVFKALFIVGLSGIWPLLAMVADDTWMLVMPVFALALCAFVLIAKHVGERWRGLCYWLLLVAIGGVVAFCGIWSRPHRPECVAALQIRRSYF